MNKAEIICKLHAIADHHLLGPGEWPARRKSLAAFWRSLRDMGLEEDVSDVPATTRLTALGKALHVEPFMAFIGGIELWEIPTALWCDGSIAEADADAMYAVDPQRPNRALR